MSFATEVKLMALDPAHFHAALVQKEMLPGIDGRSYIYAPLGQDLFEHLKRIQAFNTRADRPTDWELDIHCTDDPVRRMCTERPGNVVVIAGRKCAQAQFVAASQQASTRGRETKSLLASRRILRLRPSCLLQGRSRGRDQARIIAALATPP